MDQAVSTMDRVMRFRLSALRDRTVTYSKVDLVAVALIAVVVSVWATSAGGSFSILALLACEVMFFAFYLAGSLVGGVQSLGKGVLFELPLRLVVGYAVVNTALLVLAWLSPLGVIGNFAVVLAIVTFAFFAARKREQTKGSAASLWATGICVIATTLWCQDSLDPIVEQNGVVVFKPWVDGFYHAVHIRIFADSHGASTIEDFRMAGVPARLYHYGMYMLPAFIKKVAAIHSYTAFAGILAPVGVFFTGLAAYAFFGSLWGAWPGLAASAALLLLPDGAQQGLHNPFMSYHWLTHISPSATYGLALLAVAWLFVIQGCTQGNRLQLLTGWLVAGILAFYKLHYVVASAFLLLLVPALFFRADLGRGKRALWVVSACVFYVVALMVGQKVPGVPLIRFDGSSIGEILHLVGTFQVPGTFPDVVVEHMGRRIPATTNLLLGIPYVLFAFLGAFVPLLLVLLVALRKRTSLLLLVFPLLLLLNFLAMFFGLALDMRSSTPDELQHRPLMIVYFFVVAWVGGASGLILEKARRSKRVVRPVLLGLATVLLIVPATLGEGVQLMWAMPKISPVRLPLSLIRVAEHLRTHGGPQDLFQDSQFDRYYAIAALSERRTFVAHTMTNMPYRGDMIATRSAAVDRIMLMRLPKLVVGTARAFGIRWFIRHPGDRVNWPPELAAHPALKDGPFTVYDFK
jgi:hypothetical protein